MNVNIIKSYKYFVLQPLVNKYGRSMKRKKYQRCLNLKFTAYRGDILVLLF